jgi:hypothetical protein
MRFLFSLALSIILFIVISCAKQNQTTMMTSGGACSTTEVPQVHAHWQAFMTRDVTTLLAQYAKDAQPPSAATFQGYYQHLDATQGTITDITWFGTCKTPDGAISFYVQHVQRPDGTGTVEWYVVTTNQDGLIEDIS